MAGATSPDDSGLDAVDRSGALEGTWLGSVGLAANTVILIRQGGDFRVNCL